MNEEKEAPQENSDPTPPGPENVRDAPEAEEEDALEAGYVAARNVVERNGYFGNMIVVGGDFIGSVDRDRRSGVPVLDITDHVDTLEKEFVEPTSYEPTVRAIEEHAVALLFGSQCGNRVTASVALRRTGHESIVELPGALSPDALVDAVKRACRQDKTGVLVDSVEPETLNAFTGFQLRHLRDSLPQRSAVVLTTPGLRLVASLGQDLPVIEGSPPDPETLVDLLAQREKVAEDVRERAQAARRLLPDGVGPAAATDLLALASTVQSAEELAALIAGRSQALDSWLEDGPDARSVGTLAAAASLNGLPAADFDGAMLSLGARLEGEVEPPSEPPAFRAREQTWPPGLVAHQRGHVATYFGWQETDVIEICPPHRPEAVIQYLWDRLDGDFRRPFMDWLRELHFEAGGRLAFGAARTAGVLFARDPVTIERELLRPWAMEGSSRLRAGVGLAIGMPVVLGSDSGSSRRLLRQWATSPSPRLRKAAIAGYGGPLGIWDPSAAAVPRLWELGWAQADLTEPADRALGALFGGGKGAARARYTASSFLRERSDSKEAARAFGVLPFAIAQLTGGSRMARESLEGLLSSEEVSARRDLADLLTKAFDSRDGRESAKLSLHVLLSAGAAGRISRNDIEFLIREMKAAARTCGRLPQLGAQLKQTLKAEERERGRTRDMARSLYETFYEQVQGGQAVEGK